MSPSSRMGLTARGLLSGTAIGAPGRTASLYSSRVPLLQATRLPSVAPFTTSLSRPKQVPVTRVAFEYANPSASTERSPKGENSQRYMSRGVNDLTPELLGMVLPGTFILPTLSQLPKPLGQKLWFLGQWLVMHGQEFLTNTSVRFMSKPSIFKRALFRPKKSVLIPTAKSLHRSMAAAFATGDKDTLNRICSRQLSAPLLASIDARPTGRRYGWELVRYNDKLFYPSVRSHRMTPMSRESHAPIIWQAVVAISSRQRRVVYDAQGQVVPGSEKEMDVVENVAFGTVIDRRTWTPSEWRLVGTVKATTYEEWVKEKAMLKTMMQEQ